MVIRERVEITPAQPAAPIVTARKSGGDAVFPGSGRDALDLPVDPLQFGPVETFAVLYPRPRTTPARLTAAQPGQGTDAFVEIIRNPPFQLFDTRALAPGFTQTGTYPIGVFNGSTCGEDEWHYTEFQPILDVPLVRFPWGVGLGFQARGGGGGCTTPNSITNWCPCYLNSPQPTKYTSGFDAIRRLEPIVPSDLLVTAAPDTLDLGSQADLTLRLIDPHGYEVHLDAADGFDATTAATLSAPADSAAARGLVLGATPPSASVETTYGAARGGAVRYAAGTDTLWYDTPVTVSAAAGGFSGSGRLVLRGRDGAGPDSLVATPGAPTLPCGDSTLVSLKGFLDGEARPLPDSARVALTVTDSLRSVVSVGGARSLRPTVTAAALRDSTVYLATQNCADLVGEIALGLEIEVEAPWAEGGVLRTELEVTLLPPRLLLTVTPPTVRAGGSAALVLETVFPDDMPIALALSDDAPGGFERAAASGKTGDAASASASTFSSTVGGLPEWRFVADGAVTETTTATITATVGGREVAAAVTVEPVQLGIRILRQNGDPVPAAGPEAFVSVSKVRPDWLLPTEELGFEDVGGANELENQSPSQPQLSLYHDPDTYRFELDGLPSEPTADVVFQLSLGGASIWTDGRESGASQTVAEYASECQPSDDGLSACRARRYVRLVSNSQPTRGGLTTLGGAYDDEVAGLQTIRVSLGDVVSVRALERRESGDVVLGDAISLPVGSNAVQQAVLMWHAYVGGGGTAAVPDVITERMSEDWAQAGILFRQAAPVRGVPASGLANVIVVSVPNALSPGNVGTVSGDIRRAGVSYAFTVPFGPERPFANLIAEDIEQQIESSTGIVATSFVLGFDGRVPTEAVVVLDGSGVVSLTASDESLVSLGRNSDTFRLSDIRYADRSRALYALARAVHNPENTATVNGSTVDVVNVFVAPLESLRSASGEPAMLGSGAGDPATNPVTDLAIPNTLFLSEPAADLRDNLSSVAGHEVGHVLLVGDFSGSTRDSPHHPIEYNLMNRDVEAAPNPTGSLRNAGPESVDGAKRLTPGQYASARCESTVGYVSPLCLPSEPRGPSILLTAPGIPVFFPSPALQAPPTGEARATANPSR